MGRMFEKRKHTMFKRWDRMAKAFTRVGKEIAIAVRAGGPNPDHNPALRRAIQNARACNMPKDKVENAIAKASGEGADDYQELVYEGYAPHGVALLIETATDNPTRTIANIRNHFKKCDGSIGATGSVSYMFDKMGLFKLDPAKLEEAGIDGDELQLDLMDHGMEFWAVEEDDDGNPVIEVRCAFNDFGDLQAALEERSIDVVSSQTEWKPQNIVELDDEAIEDVLKLVDRLEQDDDVQNVFHTLA